MTKVVPQARRVAALWNPSTPSHLPARNALKSAGQRIGLQLVEVPAQKTQEFDGAFTSMTRERVEGFIALGSPLFFAHREQLADLQRKHRLPGMFAAKEHV